MAQTSPTSGAGGAVTEQRRRLGAGAIAFLVGGGLLLIVVIQNTQRIRVRFLVWGFVWPTWLFALVMAVLGALIWVGLGVVRRHRRRKARRD